MAQAPFRASWRKRPGYIRHGFTHFELEVEIYVADIDKRQKCDGIWMAPEKLSRAALPTAMRKIIAHAHPTLLPAIRSKHEETG
jgi:A/G-specific adenine glycosylase